MGERFRIRVATEVNPGDEQFDKDQTPILDFTERHHPQPGWNLCYIEMDGDGVEDHWIGGDFKDLDWALAQAQAHLERIGYPSAETGEP
ncbi:hypothetical protein SCMU_18430 [Sinomonas cyclohexanicum]|uniref:Uncharacterized protein n=1 Tax=Sinomonas cyclohexanicum TaxID=322009 RepID=A0ABM7PUR7_SINCY|nr:hypothetical protein [Corynebacterium cyclohexanicum]BCT76001.1 hypothetical protein SCMU_18430 [Corynebacterium cyclohexanicum]